MPLVLVLRVLREQLVLRGPLELALLGLVCGGLLELAPLVPLVLLVPLELVQLELVCGVSSPHPPQGPASEGLSPHQRQVAPRWQG